MTDEDFVRLFGSEAFEIMREIENPWEGLVFLRSAPGGGKTTLLRLLTPRPLDLTHRLIETPQVKSTRESLLKSGAVTEQGSIILGTMVVFATEYRELAEFDRGNSLFRELLNSRIVIAVLRALLERSERGYPQDLHTIHIQWEPESGATIPADANGSELFQWASTIEDGFYERMDDLGATTQVQGGHARLDGLAWFSKAMIADVNGPVTAKRVLLLDEVQRLSRDQRSSLIEYLMNARANLGIWVAERLEALNHRELLSVGALQQRDYEKVIQLERRWTGARGKTYAKFVEQIANLRAAKAEGFDARDFYSLIAEEDDPAHWGPIYEDACTRICRRLEQRTEDNERFRTWIDAAAQFCGTPWERALRWRKTQVVIERDIRNVQTELAFFALPEEEFNSRASRIERAAEHFLRTEVEAPVYFGRKTLAAVSSWNVDQYLEVAGELFAEIAAKFSGPRDHPSALSTGRQDFIIRRVAKQRWDGIARRLPQGTAAKQLLLAIGEYCRDQTFRPNAPYVPGVTGIAITMAERAFLIDGPDNKLGEMSKLRDILTSLVAHNLLVPSLDQQQGGRSVVVFYLNRLLCVHFGLPLGRGGWRHRSLGDLHRWLLSGSARQPELVGGAFRTE